jgi:hypothetical protein
MKVLYTKNHLISFVEINIRVFGLNYWGPMPGRGRHSCRHRSVQTDCEVHPAA